MTRASAHQSGIVIRDEGENWLPCASPMKARGYFGSGRHDLATLPRLTVARRFRGTCQRKSPARFSDASLSSRWLNSRSSIVASGPFFPAHGSTAGKLFDPAHVAVVTNLPRGFVASPVLHLKASPVVSTRHHRSEPRCWIIHPRNRSSRP